MGKRCREELLAMGLDEDKEMALLEAV